MTFLKRTAVAGLMLTLFTGVGYGMDEVMERFTKTVEKTINGTASSLVRTLELGTETSPQTDRRHNAADLTSFTGVIEGAVRGVVKQLAVPVGLWAYQDQPGMSTAIRVAAVVAPMERKVLDERRQKAREGKEERKRAERIEKEEKEYREREERAREERARTLCDVRQKNVQSPLFYGAFRLAYNAGSMAYSVTRGVVGITTSCVYGILYF